MTYILGWKNYNSVFLVGDSVITIDHPNSGGNTNTFRKTSTFGEDHIYEEVKTIAEKCLKLYDLESKVILAISGTVEEAYEGINIFRICLDTDSDIKEAFEKSFSDRDVGIIAGYMEGDVPRLVSYNCMGSKGFIDHPFLKVVHSGSIDSSFVDQTEEFFEQIEEKERSDDQIMTSIIAVAQSFCFQKNIISQGVGGFFSGIRINESGVTWQKDLAFIPFTYNGKGLETNQLANIFGEVKIAMTQVRENILYACSPFQNDPKKSRRPFANFQPQEIINSEHWSNERSTWAAKWGNEVNKNCDEFLAEYYIFYNIEKSVVVIVYTNETMPFKIIDGSMKFIDFDFLNFVNSANNRLDDSISVNLFF